MQKVYLTLKVNVIVLINEGTMMDEVKDNLFIGSDNPGIVDVEKRNIVKLDVIDMKTKS